MGEWYTTRIIKDMDIFQVKLNESFSILNKNGIPRWEDPKFIYSFITLKANVLNFKIDLNLIDMGNGSYKYVSNNNTLSNESVISVMIMEGDDFDKKNINQQGSWATSLVLSSHSSKIYFFELNKSNNWSFQIKNANNIRYLISPKKMKFTDGMIEYSFNMKRSMDTYSVSLEQKGATDIVTQKGTFLQGNKEREFRVPNDSVAFTVTTLEYVHIGTNSLDSKIELLSDKSIFSYAKEVTYLAPASNNRVPVALTVNKFDFYGNKVGGIYKWTPSLNCAWFLVPPICYYTYYLPSKNVVEIEDFECYVWVVVD